MQWCYFRWVGAVVIIFRNPDFVFAQYVISDDSFRAFLCTFLRHIVLLLSNTIHTRVEPFRCEIRIKSARTPHTLSNRLIIKRRII